MSKSVIFNAIAYALQKTNSYSKNAANAIDAFFLSSSTGMNPNVNFGQLVRGPGKDHQIGTFTGILDLRGMVKVSNAVQLMRATSAPDWTPARDSSMSNWMKSYISWLQTSNLGKSVATKAKYVHNYFAVYVYTDQKRTLIATISRSTLLSWWRSRSRLVTTKVQATHYKSTSAISS